MLWKINIFGAWSSWVRLSGPEPAVYYYSLDFGQADVVPDSMPNLPNVIGIFLYSHTVHCQIT